MDDDFDVDTKRKVQQASWQTMYIYLGLNAFCCVFALQGNKKAVITRCFTSFTFHVFRMCVFKQTSLKTHTIPSCIAFRVYSLILGLNAFVGHNNNKNVLAH